jgi:hypothetical protein
VKIEFVAIRMQTAVSASLLCVFWPATNISGKKGIFSIPSLNFRSNLWIITKISEKLLLASSCLSYSLSVCPHFYPFLLIGWIFLKFDVIERSEICLEHSIHYNMTTVTVTLHEELSTFMIMCRWIITVFQIRTIF